MLWKRKRAEPPQPIPVVLYTRVGCHLCDEMKAAIERALADRTGALACVPFELREVDIDTDPALVERYGLSIPVLEIDGRAAFKGRLTPEDFARKLARRAASREHA